MFRLPMLGIRIIETTLFVLLLIPSVRAAFTTSHCDSYGECVQKNTYGVWCFSSTQPSNDGSCSPPWALPLETHINQNLSIGYYSYNGQFLGGPDYHVVYGGVQTYLCMSTRVDSSQSATLCVLAPADNTWYIDQYCYVNVVPSAKDGCLDRDPPLSAGSSSMELNPTQTATTPTGNALKDTHYVAIWIPILAVIIAGVVAAIVKKYVAEKRTTDDLELVGIDQPVPDGQ